MSNKAIEKMCDFMVESRGWPRNEAKRFATKLVNTGYASHNGKMYRLAGTLKNKLMETTEIQAG